MSQSGRWGCGHIGEMFLVTYANDRIWGKNRSYMEKIDYEGITTLCIAFNMLRPTAIEAQCILSMRFGGQEFILKGEKATDNDERNLSVVVDDQLDGAIMRLNRVRTSLKDNHGYVVGQKHDLEMAARMVTGVIPKMKELVDNVEVTKTKA